jgi:hypothetical protein
MSNFKEALINYKFPFPFREGVRGRVKVSSAYTFTLALFLKAEGNNQRFFNLTDLLISPSIVIPAYAGIHSYDDNKLLGRVPLHGAGLTHGLEVDYLFIQQKETQDEIGTKFIFNNAIS